MSDRRGRSRSPHTRSEAAAASGKQRLVVGTIVNVAIAMAWAAETLDRRQATRRR